MIGSCREWVTGDTLSEAYIRDSNITVVTVIDNRRRSAAQSAAADARSTSEAYNINSPNA